MGEKYRLLALYDRLFSTGMKNKWEERVYVDLYAGGGFSRVAKTRKVLMGSPLIALTVPYPFTKYVFCEERKELLDALETRAKRLAPHAQVSYVHGNCDDRIDDICREIPKGSSSRRVLSLCIVDPFDFGIKFETLRKLSAFYIDFVVLLAIGMDANRNYDLYVDGNLPKIDEALGNTEWRTRWKAVGVRKSDFRPFLAQEFAKSMTTLQYLETPLDRMKLVRSDEKNLPLYYLALFSRKKTALDYWDEVLKYGTNQKSLFE